MDRRMIKNENLELANAALVACMMALSSNLERIKNEIFINETASSQPAGFGIVPLLTGESMKFSGETMEEQEARAAKAKAAQIEYNKLNPKVPKQRFFKPSTVEGNLLKIPRMALKGLPANPRGDLESTGQEHGSSVEGGVPKLSCKICDVEK